MAKIGIDIDGVLANFGKAFNKHIRNVYGKDKIEANYMPHDWNWSDRITLDEQKLLWQELKKVDNFWLTEKPFGKNVTALRKFLARYGTKHDVWFVTARAQCAGDTIASQTIEWLSSYFDPYDHRGVVVVAKPELKRQILEGIGIQYMIDDHGPTVEGLDTLPGLEACLLDRPWNQDAKVKIRVDSMSEFLKRIN